MILGYSYQIYKTLISHYSVSELGHYSQCLKPFGNPILNKLIKIVKLIVEKNKKIIVEVEKGDLSNVVHWEWGLRDPGTSLHPRTLITSSLVSEKYSLQTLLTNHLCCVSHCPMMPGKDSSWLVWFDPTLGNKWQISRS